MKWIISRQIADSSPPQQGASDPISGLTSLWVYHFYPHLFSSQINIISRKKQPDYPLNKNSEQARENEPQYNVSMAFFWKWNIETD